MQNIKDDIRQKLIDAGRRLAAEKGIEFLTARKLSEASNCSIGTIYNQFGSMDELAAEQNILTLRELEKALSAAGSGTDHYQNLNGMTDAFAAFVCENRELWLLLYNFHLNRRDYMPGIRYKRQLVRILNYGAKDFAALFPSLKGRRGRVVREVLTFGLFGISAMLATNMFSGLKTVNRENISRIFSNAFLAGITLLDKE